MSEFFASIATALEAGTLPFLIRSTLMRIAIAVGLVVITVACRLSGFSLGIMIFAIVTDLALVLPAWKVMKEQDKLMDELDGGKEDVTAEH